jgi:hypothetical protein
VLWARSRVENSESPLTLDGADMTGTNIVVGRLVLAAKVKLLLDLVHCRLVSLDWDVEYMGRVCIVDVEEYRGTS